MSSLVLSFLDESSSFLQGIFISLAGNKDNYKSLNEFDFLSDPITNYGS